MKALIVYYSLDGNTRFIAQSIANEINAELLELKPKKKINPKGFMKYFWGGRQVTMREKPELLPLDKNPQDYDMIFVGTPVWAWRHTPAVETFFSTVGLKGKRIALFCCHGGGKGKTIEKMQQRLTGNEILGSIDFKEPLSSDKDANAAKARAWAKELISA